MEAKTQVPGSPFGVRLIFGASVKAPNAAQGGASTAPGVIWASCILWRHPSAASFGERGPAPLGRQALVSRARLKSSTSPPQIWAREELGIARVHNKGVDASDRLAGFG